MPDRAVLTCELNEPREPCNQTQRRRQALRRDHRRRRPRPRCAAGDLPRPARPQRRRQVDDDAAADRPGAPRRGRARGARARRCPGSRRRRARRWASSRSSTTSTSTSPSRTTSPSTPASTGSRTSGRRSTAASPSRASPTGARTRSTSSRAACAGACCWPAGSCTSRDLLLLDEPTVGLDPQIRTELWSLIDGLRTRGKTILMSTHYIEEAERLADEVAVMTHGKIIARGRPAELIAEHAGRETAEVYGAARPARRGPRRGRGGGPRGPPRRPGDRDRRRRARQRRRHPR